MPHIATTLLLALPLTAFAADLGVPLSWRKFSNSRPLEERQKTAQDAITNIRQYLNRENYEFNGLGYWVSANTWSAIALNDKITGKGTNGGVVRSALRRNFFRHTHFYKYDFNDDALWWGTASIYAYRAYNDKLLLSYAVDNWNEASKYFITVAHAAAGKHPLKTTAIKGSCNGATMAGGVFWKTPADDMTTNVITTGLYMTLSAYLAEATRDDKYTEAATLSANWIKNQRYQHDTKLALDTINAADCKTSADSFTFTYNSGKFVEGLAVLKDVTKDSQWATLMTETVAAAVKTTKWQGADGIITEGQDGDLNTNNDGRGFKAIFIRGLHEVFQRSASNQDLQILIHSYVDVQYNALLDLASNGTSYGVVWHGPYNKPTSWGQNAALDVLVAAIGAN